MSRQTAAANGLMSCECCMKLVPQQLQRCPRCGTTVHLRHPETVQRTLALLVTATILYVPANVLPIMYTDQLGRSEPSTIMGGVLLLIRLNSFPIAAVIFIASVVVPLSKLAIMYYLCWSVSRGGAGSERQRTTLYRVTELIGKWSMVDVFVVSILVALVHVSGLIVFRPGPAALAFAGVVISTMLAAEGFDQRLIWDRGEKETSDDNAGEALTDV